MTYYPVSDAFVAVNGHEVRTPAFAVEILEAGVVIDAGVEFLITGGSVTADSTATNWRTGSLSLIDPTGDLTPASARDLLSAVSGREFRPRRGNVLADGSVETVPLATLKITSCDVEQDENGRTAVTLAGVDRSRFMQQNKWIGFAGGNDAHVFGPGGDYIFAVFDIFVAQASDWMMTYAFPQTALDLSATGFLVTTLLRYQDGGDPWNDIQNIVKSVGYRSGFDVNGVWRTRPEPDPDDPLASIVFTFSTGKVTSKVTGSYSDTDAYNGVIAVGQNSFGLTPARGVVWDDNPSSPTYYLGPNGKNPFFREPDPLIGTPDQAIAAARGELNKKLGLSQVVTVDTYPNPRLDLADYVQVHFDDSKLDSRFIIDRIVTPMSLEGTQQLRMRERRIAA